MVPDDVVSCGLCYYSKSQDAFDVFEDKWKTLNIIVFLKKITTVYITSQRDICGHRGPILGILQEFRRGPWQQRYFKKQIHWRDILQRKMNFLGDDDYQR